MNTLFFTDGVSALEVLRRGLRDLVEVCVHMRSVFKEAATLTGQTVSSSRA